MEHLFYKTSVFSCLCCVQPVMYVFPKCPDDGASLLQDFSFFHVYVVYSLWCMYSLNAQMMEHLFYKTSVFFMFMLCTACDVCIP